MACIFIGMDHALAQQGTNVNSVEFIQHTDESTALEAIQIGNFDIYYYSIPHGQIPDAPPDGIQVFDSIGGTSFNLLVNPAQNTEKFNPFAHRDIRYALNFLVDRDHIVNELFNGNGHAKISNFGATHKDYLLVYRQLDDLGIRYDPQHANDVISEILDANGAIKSADGKWSMNDNIITVTIFIRNDDPIRDSIGNALRDELEKIGFEVIVTTGNLENAFKEVYGSDPADLEWHIYTGAYRSSTVIKEDNSSLAAFYAPWRGSMPGWANEEYWNYENNKLDTLTYYLYTEMFDNAEERADLVRQATLEGVRESVRISLAVENHRYIASNDVSGVINTQGYGITHRTTPINASIDSGDLKIGVKYIRQTSWNPVLGFGDTYSSNIFDTLYDPAITRDPFTGDLIPVRSTWSVDTDGPDNPLNVPDDAISWDLEGDKWTNVNPDATANSMITFEFKFGNWHNGIPMNINDILYPAYFITEWSHNDQSSADTDIKYDNEIEAGAIDTIKGIRVTSPTTIEVYTDYWNADDENIAAHSSLWSSVPWEIYAAMEKVVTDGDAAFSTSQAEINDVPWISLLDYDDSNLVKNALNDLKSSNVAPIGLHDEEDLDARYDASIKWITDKGNAMISNGPFYIDEYEKDKTLITKAFDDPDYPLEPGHWSYLAQETSELRGNIAIGVIAPITGGAQVYGKEIEKAAELAIDDFNKYLEKRGSSWSLSADIRDSKTSLDEVLKELVMLNDAGIKLINGPSLDYSLEPLEFANNNDMLLVSCCSATTDLKKDDNMFRLTPGHEGYANGLAQIIDRDGITALIPVGINNIWSNNVLEITAKSFADMDSENTISPIITYENNPDEAIKELADMVQRHIDMTGADDTAVLYAGFEENVDFFNMASQYEALGSVRWYGADFNTAAPNVLDNDMAKEFAEKIRLTVVQPRVADNHITQNIREYLNDSGQLTRPPSVYAMFEYDAVWLLGLAILEAQSADANAVKKALADIADQHVGASGGIEFDATGDRANGKYSAWEIIRGEWVETREINGPVLTNNIGGSVFVDINGNGKFDDGSTTTNYIFPHPVTGELEPKHTHLVLHDEYIFGAGYYTSEDPREDEAIQSAQNAVTLYKQHGNDAFETITAQNMTEDWYPFVITADSAKSIADGSTLDRRGQTLWTPVERNAALNGIEDTLDAGNGAWITYVFLNPSTNTEQAKRSWVIQHDGYLFGAGYYLDGLNGQIVATDWSIRNAISSYDLHGSNYAFNEINGMRSTIPTYPFVLDRDGILVAHGADPRVVGLLGTNLADTDKSQDQIQAELDGSADSFVKDTRITLLGSDSQNTTVTTSDGMYIFENVGSGEFMVRIDEIPARYATTVETPDTVTVTSQMGHTTANFALKPLSATLNINAYVDSNANGIRNEGEKAFAGLIIFTSNMPQSLLTDSEGMATVNISETGHFWTVAFKPIGYDITTQDQNDSVASAITIANPVVGATYTMNVGVVKDNTP